jgi:hypothetical protein
MSNKKLARIIVGCTIVIVAAIVLIHFEPWERISSAKQNLTIVSTFGGSVPTPGQGNFTYDTGTAVNLMATPASGYRFVNWTSDADTIEDTNAASTTITMNGDYSITANFVVIPPVQYRLTISSTAGGSVTTPGEGTFTLDAGTVVSLVASADTGYQFDKWTGDVGTIANVNDASSTIVLDSDTSITANFDGTGQTYTLSIDTSPLGAGFVSPSGGTYGWGVPVTLTARSASGYTFDYWSGSESGTEPTITVTMDSDKNIVANFVPGSAPSPTGLSVRIDYVAVKDAMGKIEYGEDPLIGDIQLIIAVTDGKNAPQTWYFPQEGPKGLEGMTIADYGEIQINQRIYRVQSAGDYLSVSILAYALHSKDNLLTSAKVSEVLAAAVGVPGADTLEALISLLPPVEDDRVGGCEPIWYYDEAYGIGQHQVSCLDEFGDTNLFVGLSIWSGMEPTFLLVPSTFPGVPENETLTCHMPSNTTAGSYVEYRRVLRAGEKVTGSVQLTGFYPPYVDSSYQCCFRIYDSHGKEVDRWCGDFKKDGLYQDFSFTAEQDDVYRIVVEHWSLYARDLLMVISPYGWQ